MLGDLITEAREFLLLLEQRQTMWKIFCGAGDLLFYQPGTDLGVARLLTVAEAILISFSFRRIFGVGMGLESMFFELLDKMDGIAQALYRSSVWKAVQHQSTAGLLSVHLAVRRSRFPSLLAALSNTQTFQHELAHAFRVGFVRGVPGCAKDERCQVIWRLGLAFCCLQVPEVARVLRT